MTKTELVRNLQNQFDNLKKYQVKEVVDAVFNEIVEGVVFDGKVNVPGFGSFRRKVRTGPHWDVKQKTMVEGTPVNRVAFKVGADFKRQVRTSSSV